jgi:carbohydrate-selective porin OprB
MLDNTFAMHGSASSSFHLSRNYPIISAGGKNLGFNNGWYLKFGKGNEDNQAGAGIDTDSGWQGKVEVEELPLTKLFVTILQRLGVETNSFGGLTGSLNI